MAAANRMLAEQAATIARDAPRASLERRGALCASVVLADTRTLTAARRALDDAGLPVGIRTAALEVLGAISHNG